MISMLDLQAQYTAIQAEVEPLVLDVLRKGHYILGPHVSAFERAAADFLGVPRALGLASGTDALRLALAALDVGAGDEVITTPFTFIASANTISRSGATPVFADIDPRTFNLDPDSVERAITPRTRGIVVVHLYGQTADMDALRDIAERHGLWIVEDACQAIGARWHGELAGTMGVAGCFSFYPTKNLGGAGDGGLLCARSERFVEDVTVLARHGGRERYIAELVGYNSRLDEIQAAILNVKLRHLDAWNEGRRAVAARYTELLADTPVVTPFIAPGATPVFHQYTIRVAEPDALAAALRDAGISTMRYYPVPLHCQPVYRELSGRAGSLIQSERAAAEVLSLPIYPELRDEQIREVTDTIHRFYDR